MIRKFCVVTSSRADYGLLRGLVQEISKEDLFQLQIIATGMHLSPEFGLTYREIEADNFNIDCKLEMLLSSDTPGGLTKSMGLALISYSEALESLKPDLLIILGDRFEILSAAVAATMARIPIAHISGGEISEGAFDDAFRHSITKMSHLHFVAAKEYFDRVVQMGEQPENVFLVGGMAIDNINKMELLSREELQASLGIELDEKNLLITFHPVTLEDSTSALQLDELLKALSGLEATRLIFTMPNADTDSRVMFKSIRDFVDTHSNAVVYTSLGHLRYLSCLQYVDGVVGNSSSGLSEVPSFCKATVNIGDRQRGRLKAKSVIDCNPDKDSILKAINRMYSAEFQEILKSVHNPYGNGGATQKIISILKNLPAEIEIKKRFYDIESDRLPILDKHAESGLEEIDNDV